MTKDARRWYVRPVHTNSTEVARIVLEYPVYVSIAVKRVTLKKQNVVRKTSRPL